MPDALFDAAPYATAPDPAGKLTGDARRRQRQEEAIRHGFHPLGVALGTPIRLHPDAPRDSDPHTPGPRCGSCWYRRAIRGNSRDYMKCLHGLENPTDTAPAKAPRVTHGAGTDVRSVWPACVDYSPGDPAVSADAARYVPEPVCEECNYPGCDGGPACMIRSLRAAGFDAYPFDGADDHDGDGPEDWSEPKQYYGARRVETVTVAGGVL
jgi:hypothetical protein